MKLNEIVEKFRRAIEKSIIESDYRLLKVHLDSFPNGTCGIVSEMLAEYLMEMGYSCETESGNYYVEETDTSYSHRWVVIDDIIIDITGDQFHDSKAFLYFNKKIYIGKDNSFHQIFKERSRCKIAGVVNVYGKNSVFYAIYEEIKKYL